MSHKADRSFFKVKKPWSRRKDRILGSYHTAYLPKIATQRRPIFIVDTFAGPGQFDDAALGSPLIIREVIAIHNARNSGVQAKLLCIEPDDELYRSLESRMRDVAFVTTRKCTFLDCLDEIENRANRENVFLHLNPFTVEGIEWAAMDRVFRKIAEAKSSIEVLLNFNAPSFVRRALAALKLAVPSPNPNEEDADVIDADITAAPSVEILNEIVGGIWWQETISANQSFATKVSNLTDALYLQMKRRFNEVCYHPVRALPHHSVPKYYLVFGSRHPHALRLMNDEMVKSRETLANIAAPKEPTLFELRSEELVPDASRIPGIVRKCITRKMTRGAAIISVIREEFCEYSSAAIRGCIETMLKAGEMQSATGKTRINDEVEIWPV